MQAEPAKRVQKQAEVKTVGYTKFIIMNAGTQVIEKCPGE